MCAGEWHAVNAQIYIKKLRKSFFIFYISFEGVQVESAFVMLLCLSVHEDQSQMICPRINNVDALNNNTTQFIQKGCQCEDCVSITDPKQNAAVQKYCQVCDVWASVSSFSK